MFLYHCPYIEMNLSQLFCINAFPILVLYAKTCSSFCRCVWRDIIFKASQSRGRASGSRAYERHEIQGVIIKCTRHECSVCEPKATSAPYP